MRRLFSFLLLVSVWTLTTVPAHSAKNCPSADELFSQLQKLALRFYPQAKFEFDINRTSRSFRCAYNTRTLADPGYSHLPENLRPFPNYVPEPGGILCEIYEVTGTYAGKLVRPQTIESYDDPNMKELLMAPYCKKTNTHLNAILAYPKDTSPEFIQRYRDLINSYACR